MVADVGHSAEAIKMLDKFLVGNLEGASSSAPKQSSSAKPIRVGVFGANEFGLCVRLLLDKMTGVVLFCVCLGLDLSSFPLREDLALPKQSSGLTHARSTRSRQHHKRHPCGSALLCRYCLFCWLLFIHNFLQTKPKRIDFYNIRTI